MDLGLTPYHALLVEQNTIVTTLSQGENGARRDSLATIALCTQRDQRYNWLWLNKFGFSDFLCSQRLRIQLR